MMAKFNFSGVKKLPKLEDIVESINSIHEQFKIYDNIVVYDEPLNLLVIGGVLNPRWPEKIEKLENHIQNIAGTFQSIEFYLPEFKGIKKEIKIKKESGILETREWIHKDYVPKIKEKLKKFSRQKDYRFLIMSHQMPNGNVQIYICQKVKNYKEAAKITPRLQMRFKSNLDKDLEDVDIPYFRPIRQ